MHKLLRATTKPEAAGLIIHGAVRYDLIVWLFTLGGERRMRDLILRAARLTEGETVLDIGCGTGAQAILAKARVGPQGVVLGVDPSDAMVTRAREKAKRAKADVEFRVGAAQAIPAMDGKLDVVLSTLMMHHVPRAARTAIALEIKRVLKPGGRVLAVDFAKPASRKRTFIDRLHKHGFTKPEELTGIFDAAGFTTIEARPLGYRNLHFILATPSDAISIAASEQRESDPVEPLQPHKLSHSHLLIASAAVTSLVALHAVASNALSGIDWTAFALIAAAVAIAAKLSVIFLAHRFATRSPRTPR